MPARDASPPLPGPHAEREEYIHNVLVYSLARQTEMLPPISLH